MKTTIFALVALLGLAACSSGSNNGGGYQIQPTDPGFAAYCAKNPHTGSCP